jgi:hypothetical protein
LERGGICWETGHVNHSQKIKWGLISGAMLAAVFGYAYFINL